MEDKQIFDNIQSPDPADRQAARDHIREKYKDEARLVLELEPFKINSSLHEKLTEKGLDNFMGELRLLAVPPNLKDRFLYELACCGLEHSLSGKIRPEFWGDLDARARVAGADREKLIADAHKAALAAMPVAAGFLGLLSGKYIDIQIDKEIQEASIALNMLLNSQSKIFSIKNHYYRYFLRHWMVKRLNEEYSTKLKL